MDEQPSVIESKVVGVLNDLGVPYEIVRIDPQFADTADFCAKYGYAVETCGNTIVVGSRRGPKQYSACIVKGSDRLDVNKTVKRLMGVSRLSFASAEDTMALSGMEIGGVTPFALPPNVPIYADEALMGMEYLILGSGSRSSKIKVAPEVLRHVPNAEIIPGLSLPPRPDG